MSPPPRRAPFDAAGFARTLHFQPASWWLALAALAGPASRGAVSALGASCSGAFRAGAQAAAFIVYLLLVPPLGAAAVYLLFGRRRVAHAAHRLIADLSLALVLAVSGLNAAVLAYQTATRWSALGSGLSAVRAACWPGR